METSTYLIIIVVAMKEGFLLENHAGKHAAQTPKVQRVII
jgi:hypothetical protein